MRFPKLTFKNIPPLTIALLLVLSLINQALSSNQISIQKQKGITLATWTANDLLTPDSDVTLANIHATGADWVSLVVTQYQTNIDSQVIAPSANTPTDASLTHAINRAHASGLKVLLKPHVDLSADPDHWRAQIGANFDASDWESWFTSYRVMILHYAALAQQMNVDELSVGTELEQSSPQATLWRNLVAEIRQVYSGALTYSANHSGEEFFLSWWDALDYIGIDAYYPLSVRSNPTLTELDLAWQHFTLTLRGLYATWHKPILFTELGYRSADGAAARPYEWGNNASADMQEQALAYQAFFNQVYWQPWFAGVFWWNWDISPYTSGQCGTDYTPYAKPAEDALRAGFGGLPRIGLPALQPAPERALSLYPLNPRRTAGDLTLPLLPVAQPTLKEDALHSLLRIHAAAQGNIWSLAIENAPLDAHPYAWLELLVQAESANQHWEVAWVAPDGTSARSLPLENCRYLSGGMLTAQTWQTVRIPLDALRNSDAPLLAKLTLTSRSAAPVTLWVDHVRLVPSE